MQPAKQFTYRKTQEILRTKFEEKKETRTIDTLNLND